MDGSKAPPKVLEFPNEYLKEIWYCTCKFTNPPFILLDHRRREDMEGDDDRISSLPEEIRIHIVSFLPMEEAIRISVLSTKWRKVCSSLSNFKFDLIDFMGKLKTYHIIEQFKEIVYQTLSQHDNSDINKFVLSVDYYDDSVDGVDEVAEFEPHFNEWISFAINHNVRQLHVRGNMAAERSPMPLSVCWPIISCKNLEDLMLGSINLKLLTNTNGLFPNLRTLYLTEVNIYPVDVINQLFSNCPMLEGLVLSDTWGNEVEDDNSNDDVIIPCPNLKTLWLSLSKWSPIHEIKILSKNLRTLGYCGGVPLPNFGSDVISSLDEANFNITIEAEQPDLNDFTTGDNRWASKILMDLCNVIELGLQSFYLEFLTREESLLARLPTSCCSLKHLHLDLYPTKNQVEVITFLLRSYPNLQTLRISIQSQRGHDYTFNMEEYWKTQELNTDGMLKQLRNVEIESFEGSEFELALMSFLLRNADGMEKMDVLLSKEYQNDATSSSSIKEKIQMFAKASPYAVVSVLEIYSANDLIAWELGEGQVYERKSRREPTQQYA